MLFIGRLSCQLLAGWVIIVCAIRLVALLKNFSWAAKKRTLIGPLAIIWGFNAATNLRKRPTVTSYLSKRKLLMVAG